MPPLRRRGNDRPLGDEIHLVATQELRAVQAEETLDWLGCEGRPGVLDAIEPQLPDAVPLAIGSGLHNRIESKASQILQLADDLQVRSHPVGMEVLDRHPLLALDQADPLDHCTPPAATIIARYGRHPR